MARRGEPIDVAAALRAGEDQEAARRRRAVILGIAALGVAVGLGFLARELLRPSYVDLVRAERGGWEKSQVLAPAADPGPGAGEQVEPFDGFALASDSEPAGAEVRVKGQLLGTTPLATAIDCKPGEPVTVRYQLAGRPAREVVTTCRASGLVRQKVKL